MQGAKGHALRCGATSRIGSVRRTVRIWTPCTGFIFSGCSSLFYYPAKDKVFYFPEKAGFTPEDINFEDVQKRNLHGWWFPSRQQPAKKTILFFHGNAENLTSHYLQLVWLTQEGYNLFIFDYPGYGVSAGQPTPQSCVEAGIAALEWTHQKDPRGLIVYGQSLGGIVAARTVLEKKKDIPIDLLVLDSTFSSFQRIARVKMSRIWLTWLFQPLAYVLFRDTYAPEHLDEISPLPTLVIHGEKDNVVEFQHGERIFKDLKEPKTFWRIPNGVHTDVFWGHKQKYRQEFLNFLAQLEKKN